MKYVVVDFKLSKHVLNILRERGWGTIEGESKSISERERERHPELVPETDHDQLV